MSTSRDRKGKLSVVRALTVAGVLVGAMSLAAVGGAGAQGDAKGHGAAALNPATGEPYGAPAGCCCFPKLEPTAESRFDCKADMTEFDCKAECAQLKDGRLPSGCKWTKGACQK